MAVPITMNGYTMSRISKRPTGFAYMPQSKHLKRVEDVDVPDQRIGTSKSVTKSLLLLTVSERLI